MENRSVVTRYTLSGEREMAEALARGMEAGTARKLCEEVAEKALETRKENERLRKENERLRAMLKLAQGERRRSREDRAEAYRMVLEKEADYRRARDWRTSACVGLMALGGVLVALVTVWMVL